MAGRPKNANLETARITGDKTYVGSTHEACGTNVRYTSGGGCVHCARAKQTQMREALAAAKINEVDLAALTPPGRDARSPEPWE